MEGDNDGTTDITDVKCKDSVQTKADPTTGSGPRVIRAVNCSLDAREAAIREILTGATDPEDQDYAPVSPGEVETLWAEALAEELPRGNWLAVWDPEKTVVSTGPSGTLRPGSSASELICVDVVALRFGQGDGEEPGHGLRAEVALLSVPKGMEAELEEHMKEGQTKARIRSIILSSDLCKHVLLLQIVNLTDIFPIFDDSSSPDDEDKENGGGGDDKKDVSMSSSSSDRADAENTARLLGHLRFFYAYLWRPWDGEHTDGDSEDFVSDRLSGRMALVRDLEEKGAGRSALWKRISGIIAHYVAVQDELAELSAAADSQSEEDMERCRLFILHDRQFKHNSLIQVHGAGAPGEGTRAQG